MRISSQSDSQTAPISEIDYLLVGHVSEDKTPKGTVLGGTVSYSGLTARALGHSVGIATATAESTNLEPLKDLSQAIKLSPQSTCFQNIYTSDGRKQIVFSQADNLTVEDVPKEWWDTELVHIAPLIGELAADIVEPFRGSYVGSTPQGLMRKSDSEGSVRSLPWEVAEDLIRSSDAVVLGIEDLGMNEEAALAVARLCPVTAITYGVQGVRVCVDKQWRHFSAPSVDEVDPTGAGDIFAAAFFSRLHVSKNPWTAAEIAVQLASASVTRSGLAGTPTSAEALAVLHREVR